MGGGEGRDVDKPADIVVCGFPAFDKETENGGLSLHELLLHYLTS